MLSYEEVERVTREAAPLDWKMARSYFRWAPNLHYARDIMLPSLRRLHGTIWTRIDSKPLNRGRP